MRIEAAEEQREPSPVIPIDAIDRAIVRIKAGLPGSFARADAAAIAAGAAHLRSLPRSVALSRIAARIYDPHGFSRHAPRPRPPTAMLDDLGIRLAAEESPTSEASSLPAWFDPAWHERRSRLIAWRECHFALTAIIRDEEAGGAPASSPFQETV